jgi:hypothetical protein
VQDLAELEPIRRRITALGDEELRRVVTVDAADWQPEAIAIAEEELRQRELAQGHPYRESAAPVPTTPDQQWSYLRRGVPVLFFILVAFRLLFFLIAH